ncbi:hypothetical protein HYT84_04735 [Candidatus Micrarchaeota archaeon]|nr:hypothetical protein [Candidatus Micrarchaeota archaeon]
MDLEGILQDLKSKGLEVAIIRKDGVLVRSSISMDEVTPNVIASLVNVSDAMFKEIEEEQKELEATFDGLYFVMIPIKTFILCGLVRQRDQKKELRAAADKLLTIL